MAVLKWDEDGARKFAMGVSHGVLYPKKDEGDGYDNGVVWNGLTAVNESPSGAEPNDLWADNQKYARLISAEDYAYTIEAYYYPDEFAACDGSAEVAPGVRIGQQTHKAFAFSWQTKVGTDQNPDAGYIIHLVWNSTAQPSDRSHETINDNPDAATFSWECGTLPVNVSGYSATAKMEIDSTKVKADKLKKLTDKLYGTESGEPTMPTPDEVIALLKDGE